MARIIARIDEKGQIEYTTIGNTVAIASYKQKYKDNHRVDDVIALWTGLFPCNWGTPALSHTEIGFFLDGEWWFFSSTSRKELGTIGKTGTRWIKASDLFRNPDRWIIQTKKYYIYNEICYNFPGTIGKKFRIGTTNMVHRANSCIGMEYDFVGCVADFTLPVDLMAKKKKIYCSKAVYFVLFHIMRRISPRRMFRKAGKAGFELVKGGVRAFLKAV